MTNVLQPTSVLAGPKDESRNQPVGLRGFGDSAAARGMIYDGVLDAVRTMEPTANKRHTLRVVDAEYTGPDRYSMADQKKAILSGRTLGRKIVGTWELSDNATGEIVDRSRKTIARVPYLTDRGTFIHNGSEYTVANQMRLRPGVFTRIKDNGEIEAHANILPGKGASHRYFLDPAKGIFKIRVHQAQIPLMPLLKTLGATDKQLQEAWGTDLWQANVVKDSPAALNKLYDKFVRRRNPDAGPEERRQAIAEAIGNMELDPDVTRRTLGRAFPNMSLDSIIETTKKLVDVSKGSREPDDRDHLAYQSVFSPEDLFKERVARDFGGLRRGLLHRAGFKSSLSHILPGALDKQINAVLLTSGLGQHGEETNPTDILDKQSRVTRMGVGGIPDSTSVPDEARSVQPSHMGFIDPVRSPESQNIGVDLFLTSAAKKGTDGRIYSPFIDTVTGEQVYRSPQDLADKTIALPGEMAKDLPRITAMQGGKLKAVKKSEVDYALPAGENMFSPLGNMIPLKSSVKAQRMAMASRMTTQALPLIDPEAPLVQSGIPGEEGSYEDRYGKYMGTVRADKPGRVMSASRDKLQVKYEDGKRDTIELMDNFPYNRRTYLNNTSLVRPGDTFQAGQLLAKSNYTDDNGTAAIGKNLRTAYIPFRGLNFEDAVVISASAAKRLSSEHMYQQGLDYTSDYKVGRKPFLALFPDRYQKKVMDTVDDDGAVKVGTVVKYGDPLVLAAKRRDLAGKKVHKLKTEAFTDASDVWKHHYPGEVTDVLKTKNGISVLVKASAPMNVGDKLSGRHGDKGILSAIIPDDEMPQGKDGKPFEILLNPLGVISRTNAGQIVEAALGKIAARTGKPYKVKDFDEIADLSEYALDELKKNGLKDMEDLTDPDTGAKIANILTGNRYFMKLYHSAEGKSQSRGMGGYTMDESPAKGGESGSKRISVLGGSALLSHGATEVIRDASLIRGQRNNDYWLAFMQGYAPPKPKVPYVYEKFVATLKGAGINVVPEGSRTHIMALTDDDVKKLAGDRYFKPGEKIEFGKDLKPKSDFAEGRWSAIELHEPMPSPVMEEPIRRILGLTQAKFESVMSGQASIPTGTGPKAISAALGRINLDREIGYAREQIRSGKKTHRDAAVRKLGYLKSAKKLGIHPKDWVLSAAPVIPSKFRPVAVITDRKIPIVADANYLYNELIEANNNLKDMDKVSDDVGEERLAVYDAFKAVTGLGDPIRPELREKKVQGLLKKVFGSSPKFGMLQRQLISASTDMVGRGVISPNPDLDMDQIGLPEDKAWEVYKPFIIRRLRRRGLPLMEAAKQVVKRTDTAKEEMLAEMQVRPVIVNRSPVLHRFGFMAFFPQLTKNKVIEVSPHVVGGLGADFDGDSCIGTSICTIAIPTCLLYDSRVSWGGARVSELTSTGRPEEMLQKHEEIQLLTQGLDSFLQVPISKFPRGKLLQSGATKSVYAVPDGIRVLSFDQTSGKARFEEVTAFSVHKELAGYEVEYSHGRKVGVSDDHSLFCYDNAAGRVSRTKPKDAVGFYSPVVKHITQNSDEQSDEISSADIGLQVGEYKASVKYLPVKKVGADFGFGWLIGAFVSDGWTDMPSRFTGHYTKTQPKLRRKFLAQLRRLVSIRSRTVVAEGEDIVDNDNTLVSKTRTTMHTKDNNAIAGRSTYTTFSVAAIVKFFHKWVERDGKTAIYKRLPSFFPILSTECKYGLLCGMLDGDGTVDFQQAKSKSTKTFNCKITTSSLGLVSDTLTLLRYLGIRAGVTEDRRCIEQPDSTLAKHISYIVSLSKPDVIANRRSLKLTHPEKAATIDGLEDVCKDDRDVVPVDRPLFDAIRKVVGSKAKKTYNRLSQGIRTGVVSRQYATELVKDDLVLSALCKCDKSRWDEWAGIVSKTDVFWAKVCKITPIPKQTMYDLTVPSTKVFAVNNGLIVYDTMQYHVPVSEEAVVEAVDRMLPSRNLLSPADFKSPVHKPTQEYVGGLYAATSKKSEKNVRTFRTVQDLRSAYLRGEISIDDPVEVMES